MTKDTGSAFSGISDFFGSILDRAPAIADSAAKVIDARANAKGATAPKYDAYGRLPGQPGYGTANPPGSTAAAAGMGGFWGSLSTGAKVALGVGGAVVLFLLGKLAFGRK